MPAVGRAGRLRWYIGYSTTAERKGVVCAWIVQLVLSPPAPMLYVGHVTASLASCSLPGNALSVYSLCIIKLKIKFSFTCFTGVSQ